MTRPGLFSYLCGNPVASLGSLAGLAWAVYCAAFRGLSYVAVIVVALVAARCWQCASQIGAYNRWQRQWNAMNGVTKGRGAFTVVPWLRWPVVISVWVITGVPAINMLEGSARELAIGWFVMGTVILGGYGLFARLRQRKGNRNVPALADVSPLLGKPAISSDARATRDSLPDYCRQLFP